MKRLDEMRSGTSRKARGLSPLTKQGVEIMGVVEAFEILRSAQYNLITATKTAGLTGLPPSPFVELVKEQVDNALKELEEEMESDD